jgi:hypothetical protein
MPKTIRQKKQRFANRLVKTKLKELHYSEYVIQITLVDVSGSNSDGDTWVYGVTEDREAELLRSSEVDDILANPDPPEWVRRAFETWEINLE